MARPASIALTVLAIGWCAAVLAAPLALAHGWSLFPTLVYEAAGLICHQRPERSFHLSGMQLPVCARCLGLYLSGAAGSLAAVLIRTESKAIPGLDRARLLIALAALPTGATLVAEWSGLWRSTGEVRAIAALPLGVVLGWLLIGALRKEATNAEAPAQMRYHS